MGKSSLKEKLLGCWPMKWDQEGATVARERGLISVATLSTSSRLRHPDITLLMINCRSSIQGSSVRSGYASLDPTLRYSLTGMASGRPDQECREQGGAVPALGSIEELRQRIERWGCNSSSAVANSWSTQRTTPNSTRDSRSGSRPRGKLLIV
ncbi:hypothetical protein BDW74DRAFT_150146 [Aspergillus multicolor]|uniref:uncharacterized protein n=1 Tax=Aspergillus multicolor TaxID=41759 RepID=UPI003CCE174E